MLQNIKAYFKIWKITRKCVLLCSLVFCVFYSSYGQKEKLDRLKTVITNIKSEPNFKVQSPEYINKLNELAKELRFYKSDSLLLLSKQALLNSESSDYDIGKIKALMNIGMYYSDKGNQKEAIPYFKKAKSIAKNAKLIDDILDAYNSLAGEYEYTGEYALALKEYLESMEIAKKHDKIKTLSILNENIALLYASQKDYDQAIVYFNQVQKLNKKINDKVHIAKSNANIASIYVDTKNLDYAMFNINRSIAVFEEHQLWFWLAYAYGVKGNVYLKERKYDWALFWYKQSMSIHDKKIEDHRAKVEVLLGLSEANLGVGNVAESEKWALEGYKLALELNNLEGLKTHADMLYEVNKEKEKYLEALAFHELHQELSDTIAKNETKKSLVMLKTQLKHEAQKKALVLENKKALNRQKNYIYMSLAVLFVLLGITILVRKSENIQKQLNKELSVKKNGLEKQEIELRQINQAKDKLFSIIGHDLRGPIGALQGILTLFENEEIDKNEFYKLMPKLRSDIDNLSFTLNNLLSWGRTQMNGTVTTPSKISLRSLVTENVNLLSEIASKKSIILLNKIPETAFAWSDADQTSVIIRNLISNSLKFTAENGKVVIGIRDSNDFWEVSVTDTGIGMEQEAMDKVFDSNSNLTTYGTNNEKGTGLGLSLCKEMVENNNGSIWVESTLNKGTTFYFTVPKFKDKID